MQFDVSLFRVVNNLVGRHGGLDTVGIFAAVALLPLFGFLLILAAFTIKRFKEEHWYEMPFKALIAGGVGYAVRSVVGIIVARPRPFVALHEMHLLAPSDEPYRSFPSGHATAAFAIAYIVWKHDRDWGIAFFILAAAVAVGRVFVGVHYPIDVLAGALLGIASGWAVDWFEKRELGKIMRGMRH